MIETISSHGHGNGNGHGHDSPATDTSCMINYNLRWRGKRFLVTLFFLNQWRFHRRPRAIIERHFAWAKRYFGLEATRWVSVAAYQHTTLVYSVMLGVALVAHRC